MALCHVLMNESVALIFVDDDCWRMYKGGQNMIEKESEPDIHKLHICPNLKIETLEDKHPFPEIRRIFEEYIPVSTLLMRIVLCLDPELPADVRVRVAETVSHKLAGKPTADVALEQVKTLLLEYDFDNFELLQPVIEVMDPRVFMILREIYRSRYGKSIPIKT